MAQHPDRHVQVMTDCHDICLQTLSHCRASLTYIVTRIGNITRVTSVGH